MDIGCILVLTHVWIGSVVCLGNGAGVMNYESGDVPWALRDVMNKCVECGETWIGVKKYLCTECAEKKEVDSLTSTLKGRGESSE